MMKTEPRLFRSTGLVSLGTLSSRVLGLFREILMAAVFGTTAAGSAFVVAFTIPNLFRRLFGEGALSAAFIPKYVQAREEQGPEAAWRLARNVSSLLLILLGSVSLLGMLLCSWLLRQEILSENTLQILGFLRILLPYMIWICLAAVTMGVLNAHRRFVVPAFTPCLLNLIWIAALLTLRLAPGLSMQTRLEAVCWVILAAGVLQFAVQIPPVRRLGIPRTGKVEPFGPEVREVLKRMGPAALGAAIVQVNVVVDRVLAIWVADYGPLALSYSERLIYLPLGLFATALGTVLLPELSRLTQPADRERLSQTLEQSLRGLMFIMIPASVGLAGLAVPIVRTVFERGAFDEWSTLYTSRALMFYAPGLIFFSLAKIYIPLFYANGDTKTPVKIGTATVAANLALNLLFIYVLPDGWKHAGLALGTVASSLIQVLALSALAQKRFVRVRGYPVWRSWFRQLICCIPMLTGAFWILQATSFLPGILSLILTIAAAVAMYGGCAFLLRCPALREFRHK